MFALFYVSAYSGIRCEAYAQPAVPTLVCIFIPPPLNNVGISFSSMTKLRISSLSKPSLCLVYFLSLYHDYLVILYNIHYNPLQSLPNNMPSLTPSEHG